MKNLGVIAGVTGLMLATNASAGEYLTYVGMDYVDATMDLKGKYDDEFSNNFNVPTFNAGIKFVDYGSLEVFLQKGLEEKRVIGENAFRSKYYGYGADILYNAYNLSDSTILASLGYGRYTSNLKSDIEKTKDTSNVFRFGVGGEINPTPEWGFRAMYRYNFATGDTFKSSKEFSVGLRYYFQDY